MNVEALCHKLEGTWPSSGPLDHYPGTLAPLNIRPQRPDETSFLYLVPYFPV